MDSKKPNSVHEALAHSLMKHLNESQEFTNFLNGLTSVILSAAEDVRSPYASQPDASFHDAFHCEVHNEILDGVKKAVQLVVDNWDTPELKG